MIICKSRRGESRGGFVFNAIMLICCRVGAPIRGDLSPGISSKNE
jgi:hypothetical protein